MCVCLETSLFGKLHCLNSNTITTEHAPSLSTTIEPSALGSIVSVTSLTLQMSWDRSDRLLFSLSLSCNKDHPHLDLNWDEKQHRKWFFKGCLTQAWWLDVKIEVQVHSASSVFAVWTASNRSSGVTTPKNRSVYQGSIFASYLHKHTCTCSVSGFQDEEC